MDEQSAAGPRPGWLYYSSPSVILQNMHCKGAWGCKQINHCADDGAQIWSFQKLTLLNTRMWLHANWPSTLRCRQTKKEVERQKERRTGEEPPPQPRGNTHTQTRAHRPPRMCASVRLITIIVAQIFVVNQLFFFCRGEDRGAALSALISLLIDRRLIRLVHLWN